MAARVISTSIVRRMVKYVALESSAAGNANFGRVTAQANYSRTYNLNFRFTF